MYSISACPAVFCLEKDPTLDKLIDFKSLGHKSIIKFVLDFFMLDIFNLVSPMAYRIFWQNLKTPLSLVLGLIFICSFSLASTISKLERQVKSHPKNTKYKTLLAKQYLLNNEFKKCADLLLPISDEIHKTHLLVLAQCLHQEKKYEEEIKILTQLTLQDKKDYRSFYSLAKAHSLNKNPTEAILAYRKTVALEPKYLPAYMGLLDIFEKADNRYEQRIIYKLLITKFGEKKEYLHALCRLNFLDSYFDQSISYCEKATDQDNSLADSYVYLGKSYKSINRDSKAKSILVDTAKKFPKSELAQWAAGELFNP